MGWGRLPFRLPHNPSLWSGLLPLRGGASVGQGWESWKGSAEIPATLGRQQVWAGQSLAARGGQHFLGGLVKDGVHL